MPVAVTGPGAMTMAEPRRSEKKRLIRLIGRQSKRDDVRSGSHCGVLLVVGHVGHWRRFPELTRLKTPERLAVCGISRHQRSAVFAEDHEPAGGAQCASP